MTKVGGSTGETEVYPYIQETQIHRNLEKRV